MRTLIALAICALSMGNAYAEATHHKWTNEDGVNGAVLAVINAEAPHHQIELALTFTPRTNGKCSVSMLILGGMKAENIDFKKDWKVDVALRVDKRKPWNAPDRAGLFKRVPDTENSAFWGLVLPAPYKFIMELAKGHKLRIKLNHRDGSDTLIRFSLKGSGHAIGTASKSCQATTVPSPKDDATFFSAKHKTDESYF